MSFWKSEIGEITGNPEDAFSKSFEIIPDNTLALASISKIFKDEMPNTGIRRLKIVWKITSNEYKGNEVNQSLYVFDLDPYGKDEQEKLRKHFRHLNMFKILYDVCNMRPSHASEPTEEELQEFVGRIAGIKINETLPNDKGNVYNYVSEIHSPKGFTCEVGVKKDVPEKRRMEDKPTTVAEVFDADIPF